MHLRIPAILLLFSLSSSALAAPPTFPYKAFINSDGVYVRSGPGNNYYPTDKLDSGKEVEVYRHDPGGWFAIRPPEGSFTWIASRYLQIGPDHIATVTSDRVAARVGSRFSDVRDVIQIRLERGERVEVLETKTIAGDKESPTWCKIAPPSGEFRWVFGKYVDPEYPHTGVRKAPGEDNPLLGPAPSRTGAAPPPEAPPERPATRPGTRPLSAHLPPPGPPGPEDPKPPAMRHLSPEEFQAELDRLNLELSAMLVEEPTAWACEGLAARGDELLAQAQTAVERGRARLVVNRIHQAQDIKDRHDAIQTAQLDTERRSRLLADLGRIRSTTGEAVGPSPSRPPVAANAPPGPVRPAPDQRFDGTGRLTRVVPRKLGSPQYALVDDKGAVRCYVTPAPGVNLQYYVGRRVGVSGVRGYMPEQKATHVTAKHVTNLDRSMIR